MSICWFWDVLYASLLILMFHCVNLDFGVSQCQLICWFLVNSMPVSWFWGVTMSILTLRCHNVNQSIHSEMFLCQSVDFKLSLCQPWFWVVTMSINLYIVRCFYAYLLILSCHCVSLDFEVLQYQSTCTFLYYVFMPICGF